MMTTQFEIGSPESNNLLYVLDIDTMQPIINTPSKPWPILDRQEKCHGQSWWYLDETTVERQVLKRMFKLETDGLNLVCYCMAHPGLTFKKNSKCEIYLQYKNECKIIIL